MPSTSIVVFFIVLQLTQNIGCYADCSKCNCTELLDLTDNLKKSSLCGAVVVGVISIPALVAAAGFGPGGIAAGSFAAFIHKLWFGGLIAGPTGWFFSFLQSIGAAGLGAKLSAFIMSTGCGPLLYKIYLFIDNCHQCCPLT